MTKSIKIDTLPKRIALLAAAAACAVAVIFILRWCAGNAIASNTGSPEVAAFALSLAPGDPQTHYTSAVLFERAFKPDELAESIAEYELAAALAPNDYRMWLALGRARERSGDDAAGAEAALRKSLELAPNYSEVEWFLGNVLLREGKTEEAFAHLRKAAEGDPKNYINPTVSTAWQIFEGDSARINKYLGDSPEINSAFVARLAGEERFDDAIKIWNLLPAEKKKTAFKENGNLLFKKLLEAKKYRAALQIFAQIGDANAETAVVGSISDGGFEADIKTANAGIFEWQIQDNAQTPQPQIVVDNAQKHGGERSLELVFNSPTGRDFRAVSQTVAVEPARTYVFEIFYKSELKTAATLYWEIVDAADGKILAALPTVAAASSAWTHQKAEFVVSEKSEAVIVRLARETCKSTLCPISGRVWFDDFSITR